MHLKGIIPLYMKLRRTDMENIYALLFDLTEANLKAQDNSHHLTSGNDILANNLVFNNE